jgi:predicted NACHT family NTPase
MLVAALFNQLAASRSSSVLHTLLTWCKENQAVVAVFSAILGGFLTTVVWPSLKTLVQRSWSAATSRIGGHASEKAYLNYVIDQHQFLPILPSTLVPVTSKAHVGELDDIYVALSINFENGSDQEASIGEAFRKYSRIVILGDPGSGKTTLLRYLALTLARARRGPAFYKSKTDTVTDRLKITQARIRVEEEYTLNKRPLPVFVYLNRWRDIATWPGDRPLLDYLEEEWKQFGSGQGDASQVLRQRLKDGECIFLFDAFDELATDAARKKIATLIGQFCSQVPKGNRFVVSSRIVGYRGQLSEFGFQAVTIQKLSWSLVTNLVSKWYAALSQESLAGRLLDAFKANDRLLDLATNPMLLSLIVLVQYVLPLIPDKRHVLYDECLKVLIERRYAPPSI